MKVLVVCIWLWLLTELHCSNFKLDLFSCFLVSAFMYIIVVWIVYSQISHYFFTSEKTIKSVYELLIVQHYNLIETEVQ